MRLPFASSYPINQSFNDSCCRASYSQYGMNGHNGIDYGLPCGTPVLAATSGSIYVGYESNGYGNYIFITASDGSQTVYGHLSKIQASGQVSEGQQIALSGNTGNSTGCHLHFGYRPKNYDKNNGFLGYIDPAPLLGGDDMADIFNSGDAVNFTNDFLGGGDPAPAVTNQIDGKRTYKEAIENIGKDGITLSTIKVNQGDAVNIVNAMGTNKKDAEGLYNRFFKDILYNYILPFMPKPGQPQAPSDYEQITEPVYKKKG